MSVELDNIIQLIKNATLPGENTAVRVGTSLELLNSEKVNKSESFTKSQTLDLINQVKALAATGSEFIGTLTTDTPPADIPDGDIWAFAEEGTYPNAGGSIVPDGTFAILTRVDDVWGMVVIDVPGVSLATVYSKDNDTDAVTAKLLDLEYFGGVRANNPETITTYTNWSAFSTPTGAPSVGVIYTPLFPLDDKERVVTDVRIKGFGSINLYIVDSTFNSTLLTTLDLVTDGENIFSNLNLILPPDSRIGISTTAGSKMYFNEAGVGINTYASSPPGTYQITMPLQYTFDSGAAYYKGKVNEVVDSKLSALNISDNLVKNLFKDDFSSSTGNWITSTWNLDTSAKKYTSSTTGRSNNLFLDKVYNLNKRKIVLKLIPSSNTDLRIELKNKTAGNDDGASMFSINFAAGKIRIFNVILGPYPNPEIASAGVSETSILKEENLIPYVAGREYVVELKFEDMAHTLSVTDSITGARSVLYSNGWSGGRQQQSYSFYVYSGGVVSVKDVAVYALENYFDTIFAGDSITEGIMVYDKSKRWWKLMETHLQGKIAVSARGGQTLQDLINRFPDEIAILKPKYLVVLIGINQPSSATQANYTLLKNMCEAVGITLKACLLTCINTNNHIAINNNILAALPPKNIGYRFNLATSVNNDGITINSALFYDNIHPIESGCQEMMKRVFADIPEILKGSYFGSERYISQAEYDALSEAAKYNGTKYFVS